MTEPVIPFRIAVSARPGGDAYDVQATADQGEARSDLNLPDPLAENAARLRRPNARIPVTNQADLGRLLGQALFAPPVHELLLRTARAADQDGARLQVQVQVATPDLAALPWEWLSLGSSQQWRPAVRDDYALVRVSRQETPTPPVAVRGPLRVLAIAARGEELQLDELDTALSALGVGRVELRAIRNGTAATLESLLRREPFHILHCAAPVELTSIGSPQLVIGPGIDAGSLARLLAEVPTIRLVTITGSQGDAGVSTGANAALAATLLNDHLPATIAFGSGLPPALIARFAADCYGALAAGEPIDLAVTAGRQALAEGGRGWGAPQLRLVPSGEQLFRFRDDRSRGVLLAQALRTRVTGEQGSRRAGEQETRSQGASDPGSQGAKESRPEAPRGFAQEPDVGANRGFAHKRPEAPRGFAQEPDVGANRGFAHKPRAGAPRRRAQRRIAGPPVAHSSPVTRAALFGVVVVVLLLLGWWLFTPASGAPDAVRATPASANLQPTVAPTPIPGPLSVQPPRTFAAYLVAEGDTLETIAARFGSDPVAIQRYNFLEPNAALRAGRPLVLPIYQPGETPATVLPVTRGNPASPLVALTFDIELDDQSLLRILETLRQRNIRATFFLAGNWVKAYPDAARAIVKDGHELANHSMTHPYFSRIGDNGVVSELSELEALTLRTTGVTTKPYFRFPYGDFDGPLTALIARQGYVAYQWNVDDASIARWLDQAAQRPEDAYGSIILLHGRQSIAEELGAWVDRMKALGLRPTTLTEVLR